MKLWEEGYEKWVEFRQMVLRASGDGLIKDADVTKLLGNRVNMGRGDFFLIREDKDKEEERK